MKKKLTNHIDQPKPSSRQSVWLLFVLFIAYTLSFIDRQILTLLVDPIRNDLGLSDFDISLLHGFAFAIFFSLAGLPLGRLADHGSRRVIIGIGICTWTIMTALCGLAKSFVHLFAARVFVGIGEASLMPAAYSMLSDAFSQKKLNTAIAIFSIGGTLGTGLAFLVGGLVIDLISEIEIFKLLSDKGFAPWQICFFIVGLPGVLVAAAMATVIEPKRTGLTKDFDNSIRNYSIGDVGNYLWCKRDSYGALFFATALMTALSAGFLMWYPSFLIRIHQYSISEAGYAYGLVFLLFGSTGVLSGGFIASLVTTKNIHGGNMLVIAIAATACFLPYLLAPQVSSATTSLVLIGFAIFFTQMIAGVCVTAIQLITPNQMRGQASAIFLFLVNCIGFGLGPSLVAIFNDFIFFQYEALSNSLTSTAFCIAPICIVWYWRSLSAYQREFSIFQYDQGA